MRRTPQEAAGDRRRAHPSQRKEGLRIAHRGIGQIQIAPTAAECRRRIIGRRQRPWAIGARPQRCRPDGAQAEPGHGNTTPGELALRARAEEARLSVIF